MPQPMSTHTTPVMTKAASKVSDLVSASEVGNTAPKTPAVA